MILPGPAATAVQLLGSAANQPLILEGNGFHQPKWWIRQRWRSNENWGETNKLGESDGTCMQAPGRLLQGSETPTTKWGTGHLIEWYRMDHSDVWWCLTHLHACLERQFKKGNGRSANGLRVLYTWSGLGRYLYSWTLKYHEMNSRVDNLVQWRWLVVWIG